MEKRQMGKMNKTDKGGRGRKRLENTNNRRPLWTRD